MEYLRDTRIFLTGSFLAIGSGAVVFVISPTPSGPWDGLYLSFPGLWIAIAIACSCVLCYADENMTRKIGFILAISLIAVLITLPTLKWGVPYGIRDPWTHLNYITDSRLGRGNVYPALHATVAVIVQTTGVSSITVLSRVQVIGPMIGVLFIVILSRELGGEAWAYASLATLPAIYMWVNSRPYSVAPLLILVLLWTAFQSSSWSRRVILFLLVPTTLYWHPIAAIVGFLGLGTLCITLAHNNKINGREEIELLSTNILFIVLIITHLLLNTQFIEKILFRAAAPSISTGSSDVLLSIPQKISETLRRGMYVLGLGIAALGAAVKQFSRGELDKILSGSIIAAGALVLFFIGVGLAPGIPFGIRRATALGPMLLVPAAIIAVQETDIGSRRILLTMLLLSGGVVVTHDSPLIGGNETSTIQADVANVQWLHDYRSEPPVVGSENTLYIVEGKYGREALYDWTNENRFTYQSVRRSYGPSWNYRETVTGPAYVVISEQVRRNVQQDPSLISGYQRFNTRSNRVYDSGSVWTYPP